MAEVPQLDVQVVESKRETTSGTEETSGFTGVPVFNAGPIVIPETEMQAIERLSAGLDPDELAPGLSTNPFGFSVYFDGRWTSAAVVPPWMTHFLPICGLIQTTRGGGVAPQKPTLGTTAAVGTGLTGTFNYKVATFNLTTRAETEASAAADSSAAPSGEAVRVTFANPGSGKATMIYRKKSDESVYTLIQAFVLGDGAGGNQTFDDEQALNTTDTFTNPATSTAVVCWLPISENIPSNTLRGYLDSHIRRNSVGTRGLFSYEGSAGRRIIGRFAMMGRIGTNVLGPTMPQQPVFPGQPPRIESANLSLVWRYGDSSATGGNNALGAALDNICFSDISGSLGAQVSAHTCGNEADGIKEYSVQGRYAPAFNLTIDGFKGASQWDPTYDKRKGTARFGTSFLINPGVAGQLKVIHPDMQIADARPTSKDAKYAGYALNFNPQAYIPNYWMRIERSAS